jgi:hypothetical protein
MKQRMTGGLSRNLVTDYADEAIPASFIQDFSYVKDGLKPGSSTVEYFKLLARNA